MNDLHLVLRFLRREWRTGELRIVLVAVALAVASVTSVAFFADRLRQALTQEANTLLAADLVLAADRPIDAAFAEEASRRGLAVSRSATFPSMARAAGQARLAGIKAVTPGYPLRGRLRIADAPFADDRPALRAPGPGQAWVDERLALELNLRPGRPVEVGDRRLMVTAILTHESERGGNFMLLAPRLLMAEADLAATGLVREGSRVNYRLQLAGPAAAVAAYRTWAEGRLGRGQKLEDVRDARPQMREVLDKAERYLGLSALLTVLLAAAASQMALRRFVERHFDQYALLRCFGASRARLFRLYFGQFLALGLLAGGLGALAGLGVQQGLAWLLADLMRISLPPPSWRPFLLGGVTGLVLVLAFSLPALTRLARVPALRVLRRDLGMPAGGQWLVQAGALAGVAALLFWQAGDARLGALVLGGLLAALAAAWGLIRLVLWPLPALAARLSPGPRLGLLGLRRRGWETTLQVMALSLGLLALLLLTLVRDDLLDSWKNQLPAGAPNRFAINIQPGQVAGVSAYLEARGVRDVRLHPMVRGRLTHINDRPVSGQDYQEDRARRLAEREFNLSSLAGVPEGNRITAGQWWRPGESGVFSVESGLAKTLGIRLGDRLAFDVGGLPVGGRVTSLRQVDWDSFRVNFFVLTPPGVLDGLPASHITSFHLPRGQGAVLSGLVAAYPNVTVIDVEQVMAEARAMLEQVSLAVQGVFLFTLGVGVLVLVAALHSRRDERAREIGLWRTLGASRRVVRQALGAEFALLGALAGGVAAAGASGLAWVLATRVFELPHVPDLRIWLAGLAGGVLLVAITGLLSSRSLLNAPPLVAVRAG